MNIRNLNLIGGWVLIEMDQSKKYRLLEVPDSFQQASPMGQVVMIGTKVPEMIMPGDLVLLKAFNKWKKSQRVTDDITGAKCYIAHWKDIEARIFNGKVYPVGRRILVKRIMSTAVSENIVGRDYNKNIVQSLEVEIVQFGISLEGKDFRFIKGLKKGDRCKLTKWEMSITELGIMGKYHLIVDEENLQLKYEIEAKTN
jgi:co-chaperonin GroES (HSP10)